MISLDMDWSTAFLNCPRKDDAVETNIISACCFLQVCYVAHHGEIYFGPLTLTFDL